jgi:hypothetical protein
VQGTAEGEPFTHEELLTCWRWPEGNRIHCTTQKAALEN